MIAVGKISKSVGIKGEMKVALLTDSPDRFRKLKNVWIGRDESSALKFGILACRLTPDAVVMRVEGIATRSDADKLRAQFVYVADKESLKPKKGTYFIHEVVGMRVLDEAGTILGTVSDVMQLPANDVWVIKTGEREILIPAIKEIVRSVDVGQKTIVIRPMEGLLD